jgi:hypothetical protein
MTKKKLTLKEAAAEKLAAKKLAAEKLAAEMVRIWGQNVYNNCPIIAYKKGLIYYERGKRSYIQRYVLITLLILPAAARRAVSPQVALGNTFKKIRVPSAKVIAIHKINTVGTGMNLSYQCNVIGEQVNLAISAHDRNYQYNVGELVKPREKFYANDRVSCASGIHCFRTIFEAMQYHL